MLPFSQFKKKELVRLDFVDIFSEFVYIYVVCLSQCSFTIYSSSHNEFSQPSAIVYISFAFMFR